MDNLPTSALRLNIDRRLGDNLRHIELTEEDTPMVQPVRSASLAVVLILLTSSIAFAECAWVLWRHGSLIGAHPNVSLNEPWRPLGTWSSRTECETNKPMYAKRDSESFETPEAKEKWRYLMREYAVQAKVDLEYLCFPDTMDPREWKGK